MYENILVPVDPSHQEKHEMALAMAETLADKSGASITALTVVEPLPSYVGMSEMVPEMDAKVAKIAQESLDHFAKGSAAVQTVVLHGSPGAEIVEYAKSNDVDCIVIASHKPGLSDYFLGSTAARVVRHATCCVHVMR